MSIYLYYGHTWTEWTTLVTGDRLMITCNDKKNNIIQYDHGNRLLSKKES